jgi:hypothetical protein
MSNLHSDHLIAFIHSLSKAEKRSFKLYATRNSVSSEDLKFLALFDYIDKNTQYTDEQALAHLPQLKKAQLSNIKAHLYKQLLMSLRLQNVSKKGDIEVREMIDHAQVLYQKGFYMAALKILDKAKNQAVRLHNDVLTLSVVQFEKIIESQYITRSMDSRADELIQESSELEKRVQLSNQYSNIALQLYSLYLKVGFVKSEKDYHFVKNFFESKLPSCSLSNLNVEEKLNLYNAHVRYNHIMQDFVMSYRYAKSWVDLFENYPFYAEQNKEMYLKGMHNLLLSLFNLRSYKRYKEAIDKFEQLVPSDKDTENVQILFYQYFFTNKINQFYLEGNFHKGIELIPRIEAFIQKAQHKLDKHRIMVFYYKIACLYFGAADNKACIRYLNKIIQMKDQGLREDIHGFARLLNLIAHVELGNDELVQSQIKAVYRYLIQLGDLQGVQRAIFDFLKLLPIYDGKKLQKAFVQLHQKLSTISRNKFEKRPFLYLDIISWLESKIEGKPVQEIIQHKFKQELETGNKHYFPE